MIILPGNSVRATGYDVANSLRFNDDSNDYLTRTFSAGNRKTWSFSTWIKRCNLINANMNILGTDYSGSGEAYLLFRSGEQLHYGQYEGGGAANNYSFQTNQAFRDTSAWYNILFVWDTTQSTSSDRMKLYVNGSQITSFSSSNYPSLNLDGVWNSGRLHYIGDATYGTNLDGYLCETVFVDGTALTPTDVGEFDSDSPNIWKPIDVSGLTFGTNGFYQEYKQSGTSANSSGLGADTSGNDHHFTVNNLTAADQSIDTCTNNWSNLNAIDNINSVLSEGNLRTTGTSNWSKVNSTFSMPNGSWYVEIYSKVGSGNGNSGIGIKRVESPTAATLLGYESTSYGYLSNGNIYNNNGVITGSLATWSATDIMSMSFTGSVLKFYKNNSLIHTISSLTGEYMFSFGSYPSDSYIVNFGQDGTFSGEVTAQGNSDPNGYGNFYYSPGSFYALNTKNLAEFG